MEAKPSEVQSVMAPRDTTAHELVLEVASRHPDRVAVEDRSSTLTYHELEERSRVLAGSLVAKGVVPGAWVGICLDRTVDLVVAVLAVLRAGAAYVPLDPDFPPNRLRLMVEDAGLRTVLTEEGLEKVIQGDADRINIDHPPQETSTPLPGVSSGDLAYVIYTSGSTGRPKGVKIPHVAVVNFLRSMVREPGLTEADRLLAVTTLSFDISVLELLAPLVAGGTTCIAGRDEVQEGRGIVQALERTKATVMQATPVMWRMTYEAGWAGSPSFKALCGGEALPPDLAALLLPRVGALWNMYGPTETTVWSTCHRVEPETPVLIGRPIANTSVYILDKKGRPVPPGVPGEIYIGGLGVAVGYHDRPDLDQERFLPDPFSDRPDARMYRTGDVGRYLRDGTLECRGRVDHQVKIRGFRVELGEIEVVLTDLEGVAQAVVVPRSAGAGDDRLIAFVIPDSEMPRPEDLRAKLNEVLPHYMVPQHYVAVDTFPTTPNGKVDRKALASRPLDTHEASGAFVAPQTATQTVVAETFATVLGTDRVSMDADFFDLGGHSVLAMRAVARLREGAAPDLTIRDLFQAPTPGQLAARIEELGASSDGRFSEAEVEEIVF